MLEAEVSRCWKILYAAIDPEPKTAADRLVVCNRPPDPAVRASVAAFQVGNWVTFDDKKGNALVGLIRRIRRHEATLQTIDAERWHVDFKLLIHVVEVEGTMAGQEDGEAALPLISQIRPDGYQRSPQWKGRRLSDGFVQTVFRSMMPQVRYVASMDRSQLCS